MTNVVRLRRPLTFDSREAFIDQVSVEIMKSGMTFESIAYKVRSRYPGSRLHPSTVGALARRDTRWPRHTTLFGILDVLNVELALVGRRRRG